MKQHLHRTVEHVGRRKARTKRPLIDFSSANTLEAYQKLLKGSGLAPEEFADMHCQWRESEWWKLKAGEYDKLQFREAAAATTPEKLYALYKRHGVYWWWRTEDMNTSKGEPLWETIRLRIKTIAKGRIKLSYWTLSNVFKYRYERSAYLYELQAREAARGKKPKFEFERPWCFLGGDQRELLARRWPVSKDESFRYAAQNALQHPPGWAKLPKDVSFNLHLGNEALKKAFVILIENERKRLGVKPTGNQGQPLSWGRIELLDRHKYENHPMSDAERSQISKARKALKSALKT